MVDELKEDPVAVDVRKLEKELDIKPGFMSAIFDEDDWSFVIKMHAVMEAAVAHLLTVVVGEPRLKPFFSRLELSGSTLGKVAVIKLLDLLDERDRRFIKSLSELRNDLAHDIRFVNFTFDSHVKSMDSDQLKTFRKRFDTWSTEEQHEGAPVLDFFRAKPKLAIWYSGMVTVAIIYGIKEVQVDARRALDEAKRWKGLLEFTSSLAALKKTTLPSIDALDNPEPADDLAN